MPSKRRPVTTLDRQSHPVESAIDYRTFFRYLKMQQPCAEFDSQNRVILCGKCECQQINAAYKRNPTLDGNIVRDELSRETHYDGAAIGAKVYREWMSEAWA